MMKAEVILKKKIKERKAKICVVGLGYVGLPLAVEFASKGYFVYGLDTNPSRIQKLERGQQYIVDVDFKRVITLIKNKKFFPTISQDVLANSDVVIVCVPTPLRKVKIPDISYIAKSAQAIKKYLKKGQIIILESTSYPTTTREVVLPILKKSGLKEEKDFFLCFSPERVNPGDKKFPITKISKVVGGLSSKSSQLAKALYSKIIKNVFAVSSPETAETAKLLENTFRLVNIALANEFALVCDRMGINVWEVIEAAKTKPFGFMPFYPGPGIGGHCLAGEEVVMVKKDKDAPSLKNFSDLFDEVNNNQNIRHCLKGIDYIKPNNYQILSFDFQSKKPVFKDIMLISRRNFKTKGLKIVTNDNRKLCLTDQHPMVIKEEDGFRFKWAKELKNGDQIPFLTSLPKADCFAQTEICILDHLKATDLSKKLRLKHMTCQWREFKAEIDQLGIRSEEKRDYLRGNYLPLNWYFQARQKGLLNISPDLLLICSGRGPSNTKIPALIHLDGNFWRLLGYYLSEGCITKDRSLRVRFTFNSEEKDVIADIKDILEKMGIRFSTYYSKKDKAFHLKISSNVFGYLFRDILKCGVNSYKMRIPDILFSQSKKNQQELLKGMFRGDGGVDISIGKRKYFKNKKEYYHNSCNANINYYSISKVLFQQLIYLLQSQGIIPIFKKRDNILLIAGHSQLEKFKDVFIDHKKGKLNEYFRAHSKNIPNRSFTRYDNFAISRVKEVNHKSLDYVYSLEVDDTNIFATSYGWLVHNCIPCDPVYLSWKAKKLGFKTKMIDLASYINHFMPKFVVEKAQGYLNEKNILSPKAEVLVLGVAYKKNVKDLRESPALDIIEEFKRKGIKVDYSDPLIPYLKIDSLDQKSIPLTKSNLQKYDCVVLVTDHSSFDYDFIRKNSKLIFDTRNVYKKDFDNVRRL